MVAVVLQELVDQVAVGSHQLDPVEAGAPRVLGRGAVRRDQPGDFAGLQRPVRRGRRETVGRDDANLIIRPVFRVDRGADRVFARDRDMRGAARMPELGEQVGPLGVHSVGDAFPTRHLLVGEEAGRAAVAAGRGRDRSRLGHHQPTVRRALAVIVEHQRARRAARPLRAEPAHRRHDDPVFQGERPDLGGAEERS